MIEFESGIFIRIERDGKWVDVLLEEASEDELKEFFADKTPTELNKWLLRLFELCPCGTSISVLQDTLFTKLLQSSAGEEIND